MSQQKAWARRPSVRRAICEIWSTFICRRKNSVMLQECVMDWKWLPPSSFLLQASPDVDEEGFSLRPGEEADYILLLERKKQWMWKYQWWDSSTEELLTCLAEWLIGPVFLSIKWDKSIIPPSLSSSHVHVCVCVVVTKRIRRSVSRVTLHVSIFTVLMNSCPVILVF